MIAAAWLTLRLVVEVALGCHCDRWIGLSTVPDSVDHHQSAQAGFEASGAVDAYRCIAPRDYPRCELVSGWHAISFGVNTCTKGDCGT